MHWQIVIVNKPHTQMTMCVRDGKIAQTRLGIFDVTLQKHYNTL